VRPHDGRRRRRRRVQRPEQACRYTTEDCDLTKAFSDPPGDSNGAGPGVKLEWEETVSGGHRLTIQERNHENAYDVLDAGKPITVVYRGVTFTTVDEVLANLRGLDGRPIVAAFDVPVGDAAAVVREEVAEAVDPLVRVSDGARLRSARVVEALDDVPIELVDETGTTPYLGTGARGMGDVLAEPAPSVGLDRV
jgi:hypothetical protein